MPNEQTTEPAAEILLIMEIPEAERTIEIPAESITAAIVKLLEQVQREFGTIGADLLDGCAELARQNDWDGGEHPEHSFHDMSCPEDNFTLKVQPLHPPEGFRVLSESDTVQLGDFCLITGQWHETGPGSYEGKTVGAIRKEFPELRFCRRTTKAA